LEGDELESTIEIDKEGRKNKLELTFLITCFDYLLKELKERRRRRIPDYLPVAHVLNCFLKC
jgi:hypothetical protein